MKKLIFILSLLPGSFVLGQNISLQLISSAGDKYSSNSTQIDWSLGEISNENYSNFQTQITQGFHQSNFIVTTVDQYDNMDFNFQVYPNPVTKQLYVKTMNFKEYNLFYEIVDIKGQIVKMSNITQSQQEISFTNNIAGIYFIYIKQNNQTLKTFKLLKIN